MSGLAEPLPAFAGAVILVVGGAGFVGSNLVRALLGGPAARVVVVDNLLSAERANLPDDSRLVFVEGSIADDGILEEITDAYDYVFHLATYHGNQSSIADPLADHANNTLTSLKLFDRIARFERLRKVVYASAGCTVAEKAADLAQPTTEDSPVGLYHDSPYQVSKLIGEFYGNYYFGRYGMPFVKARFQNVYGPGEILGAGRWRGTPETVWRNVTPTFVWRALARQALPLENAGQATRDFIYVGDIVEGLMRCAIHGESGGVYNLASGAETTIAGLATLVNGIAGNSVPPDVKPARDWDRSIRRVGSTNRAREKLGFVARTPIKEGLARTIDWTRANVTLIEGAMSKHAYKVAFPRVSEVG
jgi:UDP-glucose 4-epimerase